MVGKQYETTLMRLLSLIPYDNRCLELSWHWLNDPEIRELTMTPAFTRADQKTFFESLHLRSDYAVWGVALNNDEIVGAAGLKNFRGTMGEYWGYIGEKRYWNKGLGQSLIAAVETKARDAGLVDLDLQVSPTNLRAIALYKKAGFLIDSQNSKETRLRMVKKGI